MHALAERQVRLLLAPNVERGRVVPDGSVAVGRENTDAEPRASRKRHVSERGLARRLPRVHADRRNPANGLVEHGVPQRRVRPRGGKLVRVLQQREGRDAQRVSGLVEATTDRHLQVRANALDGHFVIRSAQQLRDQRVVGVLRVPGEHLVERRVDLVVRLLAEAPHLWVVCVVARGVDHRLRPPLHVFLLHVVEPADLAQILGRVRGGEVPDEVGAGALLGELCEIALGVLPKDVGPDPFHHTGSQRRLPGLALDVVLRIIAAQHRVPHRTNLQ